MSGVAGLFELVCGALVVIGLLTRPAAFLLSGVMAVAYFYAHAPGGFYPILNGGELAVLYCFIFLYLAAAGAGPWSLDRILRKATEPEALPTGSSSALRRSGASAEAGPSSGHDGATAPIREQIRGVSVTRRRLRPATAPPPARGDVRWHGADRALTTRVAPAPRCTSRGSVRRSRRRPSRRRGCARWCGGST